MRRDISRKLQGVYKEAVGVGLRLVVAGQTLNLVSYVPSEKLGDGGSGGRGREKVSKLVILNRKKSMKGEGSERGRTN